VSNTQKSIFVVNHFTSLYFGINFFQLLIESARNVNLVPANVIKPDPFCIKLKVFHAWYTVNIQGV
jgi:hypothetical protein